MSGNSIRWWGHASVEVISADGNHIFIDPWLDNPGGNGSIGDVEKVDAICITHDHFDHIGDTVALASKFAPTIACQPELAAKLKDQGVSDDLFVGGGIGMNIGGSVQLGRVKATMTPAWHSAASGTAAGFILTMPDGMVIYHAGDTSVFGDMELLGKIYGIDVAILPIGGHFTMDPVQADYAVRLIKPKIVVPIHYGTFPLLQTDAEQFKQQVADSSVQVVELNPGTVHKLNT